MLTFFMLSYLDSNQDKQNQNLLCYHYTIGQSFVLSAKKRCKDIILCRNSQIFVLLFSVMGYGASWETGSAVLFFCLVIN